MQYWTITQRYNVGLGELSKHIIILSFSSKYLSEKFRMEKSTVGDKIKKCLQIWHADKLAKQWFCQSHAKNILISEKANEFAKRLSAEYFKGSNDWLDSWINRYSEYMFQFSGESTGGYSGSGRLQSQNTRGW